MRGLLRLGLLLVLAGAGAFWFLTRPQTVDEGALPVRAANAENGRVMFWAGGCASCHAVPKAEDRTRLAGGLALETPFGTFHAPNISPHPAAGIGAWSEAQFVSAMTKGTSPKGEHYYPAFPYTSYQRMTLADVRDLFAFIRTLPEDATPSKPHEIGFPFNVRRGLGLWKLLYLDGQTFAGDPARSPDLNRGAYLVEGPGHCAECHSPRNFMGGIVAAQRYAGGPDAEGKGWVPNITPHKPGLGGWSQAEIADALTLGMTPKDDFLGGSMASVVRNMGQLPREDVQAIAAYIKSLPAREGPPRPARKS